MSSGGTLTLQLAAESVVGVAKGGDPLQHLIGYFVTGEQLGEITEGQFSRGFTARGKPGPMVAALDGSAPERARHGLNGYTGWFAGDATTAGDYFGYEGPFPPFNDSLIHHYVFTVYALAVERVPVEGRFTGAQVREAIYPHILAEATHSGTYTLNRRLI